MILAIDLLLVGDLCCEIAGVVQ